MKSTILTLLFSVIAITSCSNAKTLEAENEELRAKVEELTGASQLMKQAAEKEARKVREAEARVRLSMIQAEREKEAAIKAEGRAAELQKELDACKGK